MTIKDLEPKELWGNFYELTRCPRPSKHEEIVREFLVNWAKKKKIDCRVDKVGNIIMTKPATKGMENRQPVVLQAHMDMVPQARAGKVHDFLKDPIETKIVDEWVYACDTTLGADDGLGVAAIMAVFESKTLKHGPLEALITTDEETGMTGAFAVEEGFMTGKILVNLDSETENQIFIGCAGGKDTVALFKYTPQPAPKNLYYAKIKVSGLLGGHSGGDIHLEHANANKVLARFITSLKDAEALATIKGGNLRNAIAREAEAVIGIPFSAKDNVVAALNQYVAVIEGEVGDIEKTFKMTIETAETPEEIIEPSVACKLLQALIACPHGVIGMSRSMPGIVETSTNMASVKMIEPGVIKVETSQRSSVESEKNAISDMVATVFRLAGAEVKQGDGYPGWKPNIESPIMKICAQTFRDLYNEEPEITAIHAGLETGLFLTKYPYLDMVSIGPTMEGVHSPDERLNIPSVGRFYNYLKEVLSRV